MGNKRYLGIDIGTTSVKAAVFDEEGKRLGLRTVDYILDTDAATGYLEFDPDKYVEFCKDVIASLTEECGKIDALSVDTQVETLILTDGNGVPVYPAVVWLDNRADEEAEIIKAHFGCERVYNVTGQPEITAGWPASKVLWFNRRRPEVFAKVRRIFMLEDWILYKLTGNFVTEPTIQSSTIYYDIIGRKWWGEMLDLIGITEDMLPRLCKTAEVVGEYCGIKVVTGMLDQIAGTIGAGISDETKISEMTGTIMAICVMKDKLPPYRADSIIPCHVHAFDGKFCLILWSSTAGMALKWFRNEFCKELSFKEIDDMCRSIPAGSDGVTMLPYFCGSTMPKYNPDAKATFTGITLSHNKGHFARSIMEAVAFVLKQNLDYIGDEGISEIRITGGGAQSRLWSKIKSDVTSKVLKTLSEGETACLGTALVAAVGVGDFSSIEEAVANTVKTDREFLPGGDDYTEAYERFIKIDKLLN